jgi:hypothetical protein
MKLALTFKKQETERFFMYKLDSSHSANLWLNSGMGFTCQKFRIVFCQKMPFN